MKRVGLALGDEIEIKDHQPSRERVIGCVLRRSGGPQLALDDNGPAVGGIMVVGMLMVRSVVLMVLVILMPVMVMRCSGLIVMMMVRRTIEPGVLAMQLVDDAEVFEESVGGSRHPGCQHD